MITLHAKAGAEAELAQVIARHWDTARRLKLIRETPHLTLRSAEGAQTDFVEIMTWRDASVPDSAPTEIQKLWAEMNRLVENAGQRRASGSSRCRSYRLLTEHEVVGRFDLNQQAALPCRDADAIRPFYDCQC